MSCKHCSLISLSDTFLLAYGAVVSQHNCHSVKLSDSGFVPLKEHVPLFFVLALLLVLWVFGNVVLDLVLSSFFCCHSFCSGKNDTFSRCHSFYIECNIIVEL